MRLLLVEDDTKMAEHLILNLRESGFLVSHLSCVEELQQSLETNEHYDIILLDRLLGRTDSKAFLPRLKRKWPLCPVLVLSAISTPNERTDLINLGADDYLGKPFSTQELIARLKALRRRQGRTDGAYLQVQDLIIDSVKRIASVKGRTLSLPTKEFLLLRTLAQEPKRVWSKGDLLDYVWGQNAMVDTNVVESTIANVRKRLHELETEVSIRNMRNAGYWLEG